MPRTAEGYVEHEGRRTWYRIAGDMRRGAIPLVLIHGGPGMPGEAFESLEVLSETRPIVRYDQIGCGRSDWPDDPALWHIDTFVQELTALRSTLGLDRVHLLGWSWGGMLALEYLLRKPVGVESLILASSLFSSQVWRDECLELRQQLPQFVQRSFDRFEQHYKQSPSTGSGRVRWGMSTTRLARRARIIRVLIGILSRPSVARLAGRLSAIPALRSVCYEVSCLSFVRRHVCRLDPMPLSVLRGLAGWNRQVYLTMWGPSEFCVTGNLATWDVEPRLCEIEIPTLITSGRYDEATPAQMERLRVGIPRSEWVLFENSSHTAFLEEPDRYRLVLDKFLDEVERPEVEQDSHH